MKKLLSKFFKQKVITAQHNLLQIIISKFRALFSIRSSTKPAQCEKCNELKSDIASLIVKVVEKDIQISADAELLALKDEEISPLKSQQDQTNNEDSLIALRKMMAQKDEKLSRLEDQQLLTVSKVNKLRADIDFIWKEFDEAARINEEDSDKP
ncbi:hypothetical protein SADUNF_Sadunf18G0095700 [Salix dunnii]|uniref:Uncharacterized protein n=1 Tax=Salix dunnii TaxID=1413687 RepID=A0A835J4C0_9ROSI|nr:hypothetical protein SADUNF_Sadunf18G0095700 [Salix dunnii]